MRLAQTPTTTPDIGSAVDNATNNLGDQIINFATKYWPFIVLAIVLSLVLKVLKR